MQDFDPASDGGAIQEPATLFPLYLKVIGAEKVLVIAAANRVSAKGRLSAEQNRIVSSLVAELSQTMDPEMLKDCETRILSLSIGKRGSPVLALIAVQLDFMDMNERAEHYLVPVLES